MASDWFPMGTSPQQFETLVPGVPKWMQRDLTAWVKGILIGNDRYENTSRNIDVVRGFDQRVRRTDPLSHYFEDHGFIVLDRMLNEDPDTYIAFIDYLVWRIEEAGSDFGNQKLEQLNLVLVRSSSEWKVGVRAGLGGLEKRVPEGVQQAANMVMEAPGHSGTLLSEAWHAAFGISPNPETAYRKAVLAVEASSIPLVSPGNTVASLGTVFAQMRDQRDWRLHVAKQHEDYPTHTVLLGMIQMLWKGQGRHAGQLDWAPNTQAEAEMAVMLAVPLIQWFSSGAIARRP